MIQVRDGAAPPGWRAGTSRRRDAPGMPSRSTCSRLSHCLPDLHLARARQKPIRRSRG